MSDVGNDGMSGRYPEVLRPFRAKADDARDQEINELQRQVADLTARMVKREEVALAMIAQVTRLADVAHGLFEVVAGRSRSQ